MVKMEDNKNSLNLPTMQATYIKEELDISDFSVEHDVENSSVASQDSSIHKKESENTNSQKKVSDELQFVDSTSSIKPNMIEQHCLECDVTNEYRRSRTCFKSHQCVQCGEQCRTLYCIKQHLRSKHISTKQNFCCSQCDYKTSGQRSLRQHIERVHTTQIIKCPKCDEKYKNKYSLSGHMRYCGKKPHLSCAYCLYKTKFQHNLNSHLLRHHKNNGETRNTKPEPDIVYSINDTVKSCVKEEKAGKNLESSINLHCAQCQLTIKKPADIGTRCENCAGPMQYQCEKCQENSKSFCGIYDHLKNHCEFVICKKCNKRFELKADAIQHKIDYCYKKKVKCNLCNYQTQKRAYLERHVALRHSGNVKVSK